MTYAMSQVKIRMDVPSTVHFIFQRSKNFCNTKSKKQVAFAFLIFQCCQPEDKSEGAWGEEIPFKVEQPIIAGLVSQNI